MNTCERDLDFVIVDRMPLPEKCVQEFRRLWKEIQGEDLSYEIAERQAGVLLAVLKEGFLPTRADGLTKNNGPPP